MSTFEFVFMRACVWGSWGGGVGVEEREEEREKEERHFMWAEQSHIDS